MLGMMNCPTENFEFYSASPSAIRQLNSSRSTANSPKSSRHESDSISLDEEKIKNKQRGLEVFSEVKRRPKISYTPDGRRMIGGKLEAENKPPEQLWGKLIGDSITTRKFCESQKQSSQINEKNDQKSKNSEKNQKENQNLQNENSHLAHFFQE